MIVEFMDEHFKHFNAREAKDAANAWVDLANEGGQMVVSLAGAFSTSQQGIALAKLIDRGMVAHISCTGANLEEEYFRLVAGDQYKMMPNYKDLKPEEEEQITKEKFSRVTDVAIPESVMVETANKLRPFYVEALEEGSKLAPYEYLYKLIKKEGLIEEKKNWLSAAAKNNIPIVTPGWEDSTLGNRLVGDVYRKLVPSTDMIKTGLDQMKDLVEWYKETRAKTKVGFFQVGGGIAGDFAICAVPLILYDMKEEVELWSYFCQISDSTTSFGSYSGAVPNEKITWTKLAKDTPSFMVESDATIVFPLIANYVLEKTQQ